WRQLRGRLTRVIVRRPTCSEARGRERNEHELVDREDLYYAWVIHDRSIRFLPPPRADAFVHHLDERHLIDSGIQSHPLPRATTLIAIYSSLDPLFVSSTGACARCFLARPAWVAA
uniref:Uncharacterized protein n=1 Tax=Triticum urartu TaxID=4572 RepID=A0A8R7PGS5_TRIUA